MRKPGAAVRRFARDESGGSLFEYALMVAGVALLVFLGARSMGGGVKQSLTQTATTFTEALGGGAESMPADGGSGGSASTSTDPSWSPPVQTGSGGSGSSNSGSGSSGSSNSGPGGPSGGNGGSGSGGGSISTGS